MDKNVMEVRSYFRDNLFQYLIDLESMVSINSQYGNVLGNKNINLRILNHARKTSGKVLSYQRDGMEHLVVQYFGTGSAKIVLIVHLDTVLDNTDFSFSYNEETRIAKGPGIGDCKASVVMAMYLIQAYIHFHNMPFKQLSVYYDAEEEGGSVLEKEIVEELAKTHDYVLVADTGRPDYGIVIKRKTSSRLKLKIYGINGHGGNALQAGANALYESAFLMTKFFDLQSAMSADHNPRLMTSEALLDQGIHDRGQFIPENTLNVFRLNHSHVNIPDYVELYLGVSCFDDNEKKRILHKIEKICQIPHIPGCKVEFEIMSETPTMKVYDQLIELYKRVFCKTVDFKVSEWCAGGLTMANIASQYAPTIDSVGIDCNPLVEHTTEETINLTTVEPRLTALYFFIEELNTLKR